MFIGLFIFSAFAIAGYFFLRPEPHPSRVLSRAEEARLRIDGDYAARANGI